MGFIISESNYLTQNADGLPKPIIYCHSCPEISRKAISVNQQLTEALLRYNKDRRTMRLESCLSCIIGSLPRDCVIKDFDVLFNPDYKADLLKIMISVCKTKPFSVVWNGGYDSGKLIYAEKHTATIKNLTLKITT